MSLSGELDKAIEAARALVAELDEARVAFAAERAKLAKLRAALGDLLGAEWMVSHDWGGDREGVLKAARRALEETCD